MPATLAPEIVVWIDAPRAALVTQLLDVMGAEVKPIGVGGPRVTEVDDLARRLDAPREDDLRKLVVERPAAFLFLATMDGVGHEDLAAAAAQETTILTLEPLAADLPELERLAGRTPGSRDGRTVLSRVARVPTFTQSPGYLRSSDPHEVLGDRRLIACESCGRPETGSLFARLYDAWHTVLGFAPLPESIDASLSGPMNDIPDDLRRVHGQIAAHARMPDGHNAVVHVADNASDHRRRLHVVSPQAELRISDTGYDLRHADGAIVDEGDVKPGGVTFIDLVAAQWRRLLDRPPGFSDAPPGREAEALACCLAALLSARTGQPESPRKLMDLGR